MLAGRRSTTLSERETTRLTEGSRRSAELCLGGKNKHWPEREGWLCHFIFSRGVKRRIKRGGGDSRVCLTQSCQIAPVSRPNVSLSDFCTDKNKNLPLPTWTSVLQNACTRFPLREMCMKTKNLKFELCCGLFLCVCLFSGKFRHQSYLFPCRSRK